MVAALIIALLVDGDDSKKKKRGKTGIGSVNVIKRGFIQI